MNNRVIIDTINLKTYALPPADNTLDELQRAINIAESLDIPNGFSYRTYLNGLASSIKSERDTLKLVKDFINISIINYNGLTTTTIDNLKVIPVIDIKRRNIVIK